MKDMKSYKSTFSKVRYDKPVNPEMFEKSEANKTILSKVRDAKSVNLEVLARPETYRKDTGRRRILATAAVSVLIVGTGTFFALSRYSPATPGTNPEIMEGEIREEMTFPAESEAEIEAATEVNDELIPEPTEASTSVTSSDEPTPGQTIPVFTYPDKVISMQGFAGSPEYEAVVEWLQPSDTYDPDDSIPNGNEYDAAGLDPKYEMYNASTQKAVDSLEGIVSKYQLNLHTGFDWVKSEEDLYGRIGTGDILGENHTFGSAYAYDDRTFQMDGDVQIQGKNVLYQIRGTAKGSFDIAFLPSRDIDNYEKWIYKTSAGIPLIMAADSDHALIYADLDNFFVTVNLMYGIGGLGEMEAFAETINFSAIK